MALLVGNAIVGQSGGPTAAINATLSGVIKGAHEAGVIKRLYGMQNGIEGFLNEELIDLTYLFGDDKNLSLLETTPSSALGSCRKKLPSCVDNSQIYKQIFDFFKKYDIRYFFYIGGNDSMDTVKKLDEYAENNEYEVRIVGVPKTIDNDIVLTDHTPGFGSAAKFIATTVKEIACDCAVYKLKAVTIVEMMGRDAGWLTAAAGLPEFYAGQGADLIYLPEIYFDDERFIEDVRAKLELHPNVVVAVSEGVRYEDGRYVGEGSQSGATDAFGHKYLAGTAKNLEHLVKEKIGCKVRSVELNLPQRCSAHSHSKTDIDESILIGSEAVRQAVSGASGIMVAFQRKEGDYGVNIINVPASQVANKVRYVPRDFINPQGNNITEKCVEYLSPLILGERTLAYENGMPVHLKLR